MKIVGYEEESCSLIVKVASDETISQNPDDYPALAYQPAFMFPDITDPIVIKKRIAIAAKYSAEQQARKEKIAQDESIVNSYKNMINSVNEYDVENDSDFNSPTN
jgi:hypothetical protein